MNEIEKHIVGQRIEKVIYSEVNHQSGKFYFDGFDVFDHGLNVKMENGYWWNLCWKGEEYFEFGEGRHDHSNQFSTNEIKLFDATKRWNKVLNQVVEDFKIKFIDEAKFIPAQVEIKFESGKQIAILIAEELNLDESIPHPFEYEFGGEIYVFHDEGLLKEIRTKTATNR